jgi:ABC-type molybdate transport system substrate-binding protein
MALIDPSHETDTRSERAIEPALPLCVHADLGLRLALRGLASGAAASLPVTDLEFGAAAQLQRRLAAAAPVDLLLTTDLAAVQNLAPDATQPTAFARDSVLLAGRSELSLGTANLLERLLATRMRIGIALPSGGELAAPAARFFARVDAIQPGAGAELSARARPLQSNGDLPSPRRIMELLGSGEVDIVLGAASALRTLSSVAALIVPPPELAVCITAYLLVLTQAPERRRLAHTYRAVLCGAAGQAMLTRHGFSPIASPV